MASSTSSLVNNLSEGIHRIKCKYGMMIKNLRLLELDNGIWSWRIVTVLWNIKAVEIIW